MSSEILVILLSTSCEWWIDYVWTELNNNKCIWVKLMGVLIFQVILLIMRAYDYLRPVSVLVIVWCVVVSSWDSGCFIQMVKSNQQMKLITPYRENLLIVPNMKHRWQQYKNIQFSHWYRFAMSNLFLSFYAIVLSLIFTKKANTIFNEF